jgi:hypothetical protein
MANEPDENEENLLPKKRNPTTRTGSVGYPFIQQKATTSMSTSSPEHGPLPRRFPKKPLQHWSRFIDSRLALVRAPFRRKVCQTGSATGQVVFHDHETVRPKAHQIMTAQDGGW